MYPIKFNEEEHAFLLDNGLARLEAGINKAPADPREWRQFAAANKGPKDFLSVYLVPEGIGEKLGLVGDAAARGSWGQEESIFYFSILREVEKLLRKQAEEILELRRASSRNPIYE